MPAMAKDKEARLLRRHAGKRSTREALEVLESLLPEMVKDQIRIAEIPAPFGSEQARAEFMFHRFRELGLIDVHIDDTGNLHGRRPGNGEGATVLLSAHLDTVFGDEAVTVERDSSSGLLRAPGIADDARGLAAMLALAKVLATTGVRPGGDLLLVATVGEEGLGNLAGTKRLYSKEGWGWRADYFLNLDGIDERVIVNGALGSARFRVVARASGGHSWWEFGRPNPIQALARAVNCMVREPVDSGSAPRRSYSFGRIGGGTSINSIPQEAWMEVDLRSGDKTELSSLEARLRSCIAAAVEAERNWSSIDDPDFDLELVTLGRRPSGTLPAESKLVRMAVEASRLMGIQPVLQTSSTDANVPISLDRQAITLGYGGEAGGLHTLGEWYDPTGCERAMRRNFLLLLALLGEKKLDRP